MADRKLTAKQRAFVEIYLSNGRNAAGAYREAYSSRSTPLEQGKEGRKLLKHPLIAPLVAQAEAKAAELTTQAVEEYAVSAAALRGKYANITQVSLRDVARWGTRVVASAEGDDTGATEVREPYLEPIDSDQLPPAVADAISEISMGPNGIKIKLHDKLAALKALGQHIGFFPKEHRNINISVSLEAMVAASYKIGEAD